MTDETAPPPEPQTARPAGRRRNHLLWLGPLVAFAAFMSYFTFFLRFPSLRDVPWLTYLLLALAVSASVTAVVRAFGRGPYRGKVLGPLGLVISAAIGAFFVWYTVDISSRLPDPPPSRVGQAAPDFTLPDQDGEAFELASLRGKRVLLVFYRGHW